MAGPNLARRTVRMQVFRREYTRIRRERGLTDADIKRGHVDPSGIWRWLNGETRKPRQSTIEMLLNVLDVHGPLRAELLDLATNPDGPGWLRAYEGVLSEMYATFIGFEAEASALRNWEPLNVPGLLQTAAYTEALIRAVPGVTEDHVRRQLEVRAQRRAVLTGPQRLELRAVIDEAVLRRPVGGKAAMREQLAVLVAGQEGVTLQVVPFDRGVHAAGVGPFVMMEFRDPRAPRTVFVESMAGLTFVEPDERYDGIWDSLMALALNPQDSAAFIAAAAKRIK